MPRQRAREPAAKPRGRPPAPIPSSISDTPSPDLRRRERWRRVEKARQYLDDQAHKIVKVMVRRALEGDVKAAKWLLEHTAAVDDDGRERRPIAPSIDRLATDVTPADTAPRVLISIGLGSDFARLNTSQDAQALIAAQDVLLTGGSPEPIVESIDAPGGD